MPKEESKQARRPKIIDTREIIEVPSNLTRIDMAHSLYYFKPKTNDIMMTHYNDAISDTFFWGQEDFLHDSDKKNRSGFAICNIYMKSLRE